MSGRMNWDRVNRKGPAPGARQGAPSGSWEPYDPPEANRRPRAEARRRPKTEAKAPTVPWGMGASKKARQRRRRRRGQR